jgi:hypothetical protein
VDEKSRESRRTRSKVNIMNQTFAQRLFRFTAMLAVVCLLAGLFLWRPVGVAIVLDVTDSVRDQFPALRNVTQRTLAFTRRPRCRAGVVLAGNQARELGRAGFRAGDRTRLEQQLQTLSLDSGWGTDLGGALGLTRSILLWSPKARRILVVLSDAVPQQRGTPTAQVEQDLTVAVRSVPSGTMIFVSGFRGSTGLWLRAFSAAGQTAFYVPTDQVAGRVQREAMGATGVALALLIVSGLCAVAALLSWLMGQARPGVGWIEIEVGGIRRRVPANQEVAVDGVRLAWNQGGFLLTPAGSKAVAVHAKNQDHWIQDEPLHLKAREISVGETQVRFRDDTPVR